MSVTPSGKNHSIYNHSTNEAQQKSPPIHEKMLIVDETNVLPGDSTQFKSGQEKGTAESLKIAGLDTFMSNLDPVKSAMQKVDKLVELKQKLSPLMSLTDLALFSLEIESARAELTKDFLSMDPIQLNTMASQLGTKMATTDGSDEFLNSLLQQTLEYMKTGPTTHDGPVHQRFKVD